jgi:hypothetical protein
MITDRRMQLDLRKRVMSEITPTGDMMSYTELAAEYGRVLAQREELVKALQRFIGNSHAQVFLSDECEYAESVVARAEGVVMSDRKVSCVIRERKLEPPSFEPLECEQCKVLKAEVERLREYVSGFADDLEGTMPQAAQQMRDDLKAIQEAGDGTSKTTGHV